MIKRLNHFYLQILLIMYNTNIFAYILLISYYNKLIPHNYFFLKEKNIYDEIHFEYCIICLRLINKIIINSFPTYFHNIENKWHVTRSFDKYILVKFIYKKLPKKFFEIHIFFNFLYLIKKNQICGYVL